VEAEKATAEEVEAEKAVAAEEVAAAEVAAAEEVAAEEEVAEKAVVKLDRKKRAPPALPTPAFVGPFILGMKVSARFKGGPSAYGGDVVAVGRGGGTADIAYDDGDFESDVPTSWITAVTAPTGTAAKKQKPSRNGWNRFQQWATVQITDMVPPPVAPASRGRGARYVAPPIKAWRQQVLLHSYMYAHSYMHALHVCTHMRVRVRVRVRDAHMHPCSRAPPRKYECAPFAG